jgi:hypothetical protein
MDFLAKLPSFEELLTLERKESRPCLKFDGNRKTFVISTTKSYDFPESTQVQKIVIDPSRFDASDVLFEPQPSVVAPKKSSASKRKILVTNPVTVESELNVGWGNGVGCGV